MRAVLYEAFQQLPEVVTVDDPACPETGVVIEVAATGLCRSDWHGWMGHDPDIRLPHVPGHEFAGVIAEVGSRVRGWHLGDRVTAPFVCACGQCETCRRGEQQVCDRQFQPGVTHWGSFAELVAIDHAQVNLGRVPDDMACETAASLGCRFATAYRAVVHHGRVQSGDWVVVHGCGGVGLSAVMIAAAVNDHPVAALDPAMVDHSSVGGGETAAETGRGLEGHVVRHTNEVDLRMIDGHKFCERSPVGEPGLELSVTHLVFAPSAGLALAARADERGRDPVTE